MLSSTSQRFSELTIAARMDELRAAEVALELDAQGSGSFALQLDAPASGQILQLQVLAATQQGECVLWSRFKHVTGASFSWRSTCHYACLRPPEPRNRFRELTGSEARHAEASFLARSRSLD